MSLCEKAYCFDRICKVANWLWSAEVKDEVTLLVEDGAPFSNLMQFEEVINTGFIVCVALVIAVLGVCICPRNV